MTAYDEMLQERLEHAQAAVLVKKYVEEEGKRTLEQYEADLLAGKVPDITEEELRNAYARFQEKYHKAKPKTSRQPLRMHTFRTVSVALASIFLFALSLVTVQAAGLDVFGAAARWTDSFFVFGDGNNEDANVHEPDLSPTEEIRRALIEQGIPESFAPTWLPEEIETVILQATKNENETIVAAAAKGDGYTLSFEFTKNLASMEDSISYVEKDDVDVTFLTAGDKEFFISANHDLLTAVWRSEGYSIAIVGCNNMEVLRKVIESIGGS